ncbi:unnamed protein product [Boreogadus saida]
MSWTYTNLQDVHVSSEPSLWLVTCQPCTLLPARGRVFRPRLAALSLNLGTPGSAHRAPRLVHRYAAQTRRHTRWASAPRPQPPEHRALPGHKPAGSVGPVVLSQLRRLLTLSPAQEPRGPRHNLL